MQSVLIGCSLSQKSFFPSFSINFPRFQFVVHHFVSSGSSPFSSAHFTANLLNVFLCCLAYSVPARFLHLDRRWCTVSLSYPHNLHLSHSTNPLIFSMLLFLLFFSLMQILMTFSWVQCFISTSQSLLHYIAVVFHLEAPLPNFVVYSFLSFIQDLFQFFPTFFPFSVTFFAPAIHFLHHTQMMQFPLPFSLLFQ